MSLMVSTNSQTKIVEVKGPSRDTRNKILTWGLWLPYEEIVRNDDERQAFIMYFFESIKMLFAKYDVTAEEISIVERQVRDVIVNNPNYYVEKELFEEIDLSDIDFD
ncbi:hypothetical protein [Cohnella sp.]|uniref:hypothetical protein n=1 Tax=Cohnella sp. TaxID=1883426 RepID=UPI003562A172